MLLLIDNFDSFTYNIVQALESLGERIRVIRNDQCNIHHSYFKEAKKIVIGPGPGAPKDAGISKACIEYYADKKPILGICLGHQSMAEVFGSDIIKAKKPMHGKCSQIQHANQGVFKRLPQNFLATPDIPRPLNKFF